MGWKKMVIFFSLVFTLFSCKNYYHNINGGYRPKKPKFNLTAKNNQWNTKNLIDTNNIYTSIDTLTYGNEKFKSVFFLKFYEDGHSFQSSINPIINLKQQKILPTYVGYYSIDEKKIIEIETFYVKHKERGIYLKEYGLLKNDTIFMYKSTIKNDIFPNPNEQNSTIYVKKKVVRFFDKPDW